MSFVFIDTVTLTNDNLPLWASRMHFHLCTCTYVASCIVTVTISEASHIIIELHDTVPYTYSLYVALSTRVAITVVTIGRTYLRDIFPFRRFLRARYTPYADVTVIRYTAAN